MGLGWIREHTNPKTVLLFFLQFLLIIGIFGYRHYMDSSETCISCHGDRKKMEELGYPQFYMTEEEVKKETGHKYAKCRDCHLGNGRAKEPEKAHKGMLRPLFVSEAGEVIERKRLFSKKEQDLNRLLPKGDNRLFEMLPKIRTAEGSFYIHPEVRNLLWHDRNPETLNFDPEIAKKTCSKSGCHVDELKQFKKTIMARNFRQRTMRTWFEPYGPHNCGPSFADLPPIDVLEDAGFDFKNTEEIKKDLNIELSKDQAIVKQKFCNVCHAGCLDCHYTPGKDGKVHAFTKTPDSYSCLGWGRGNSICHPGAMQSRRGETYIGGDYSIPRGMEPDIHFKKNIHCINCHPTGELGMGDMQRKASCEDCHVEIEDAHERSIHKNLTCTACHVRKAGGYQITIWGKGLVGGKENPFKKYSLYYGIQSPPILMKDQKGKWFPVKIWPHAVGNIKKKIGPSGIKYRWPDGSTRDMYAIIGTFDNLPGANAHLLWLEIEEIAHPFERSRRCEDCHNQRQISISTWEFQDDQGAEPFKGTYRIVADNKGLRIEDMKNTTPIKLLEGYRLEDFASWLYLKDKWRLRGDFSIKTDPEKYRRYLELDRKIRNTPVSELKKRLRIKENLKPHLIKAIAIHNPELTTFEP
jgi:hypothetical protein